MTANGDERVSVTFLLPGPLLPYTDGRSEIVCDAPRGTLRDALAALAERHPALVDRILTERGRIRTHVNMFVGAEDIRYIGGLSAAVPDGAEVSVLPAVSGG